MANKNLELTKKVKFTLPKSKLERDDIFVAVNGKAWQIKRGVEVEIPLYVVKAIECSQRQDEYAQSIIEKTSTGFVNEN